MIDALILDPTREARPGVHLLCELGRAERAEGILVFLRNQQAASPAVRAEIEWIDARCRRADPAVSNQ